MMINVKIPKGYALNLKNARFVIIRKATINLAKSINLKRLCKQENRILTTSRNGVRIQNLRCQDPSNSFLRRECDLLGKFLDVPRFQEIWSGLTHFKWLRALLDPRLGLPWYWHLAVRRKESLRFVGTFELLRNVGSRSLYMCWSASLDHLDPRVFRSTHGV